MPTPPRESTSSAPPADWDEESGSEEEVSGSEGEYESAFNGSPSPPPVRDVKGKGKATSPGPAPPTHARPSSSHQSSAKRAGSWADLDLSIIVALVSPIGNWLTGGDHIKNLFLIILLIFYLHQIVEIPWQLYLSARPRKQQRRHASKKYDDEKVAHLLALAETELRRHELFYLVLALSSPFIGATFLRYVLSALGDHNALSWFSTTLFVLATGIRPWTHLVNRLNERTQELHDALHTPAEDSLAHTQEEMQRTLEAALQRIDALEHQVQDLQEGLRRSEQLREVCDDLSEVLGDVERTSKRSERKAETARSALGARIATVELGLIQLEERRRKDIAAIEAAGFRFPERAVLFEQARAHFWSLVRRVVYFRRVLWLLGLDEPSKSPSSPSAENGNGAPHVYTSGIALTRVRSPEREKHLTPVAPRLETIPEADDSDSEGTFVSDKAAGRSRSRSKSGSSATGRPRVSKAPSYRQQAFEYAQSAVLWPYRTSVRVLVAVLPPVAKIVPKL
ncbi:hypothetical protein C8Q77DRAFT_1059551 [Trametes polyzona]|nr:hypothetical protein C8Q77DRAFT_1059551 [Trametes polyzona]